MGRSRAQAEKDGHAERVSVHDSIEHEFQRQEPAGMMIPGTISSNELSMTHAGCSTAAPPQFTIYTDGSAIGNPGPCGVGMYIVSPDTGEAIGRAYGIGHCNVPRAELTAVVLAVRLTPLDAEIDLYSDSEYVVR